MEETIRVLAALNLAIIGLSHIVQHRAWAELFEWLCSLGRPGVFCNAFLHLAFGTLIVAGHPVWQGLPVVLTVIGWLLCLKGTIYFLSPATGMKSMKMATVERSRRFIPVGVGLVGVSGVLAYSLLQGG